jgi:hypothetical protein
MNLTLRKTVIGGDALDDDYVLSTKGDQLTGSGWQQSEAG